jgi:hypothetical protein
MLVTLLTVLVPSTAATQPAASIDRILSAWETADVVCLGEDHGRVADSDLRLALVRHPQFASTVRVIVVEFANPVQQDRLDRFIVEGQAMSRAELAPVWREASGAEVWESPIYEAFFRAVKEVNRRLPLAQRVRVLGGDSPIDWARITTAEELVPFLNRGRNIREIIAQQILEPRLKGLAIYGARHCNKVGGGFPGDLADRYAAGRIWSVQPLAGTDPVASMLGLGDRPSYVIITGTPAASMPAGAGFGVRAGTTLGGVLDAIAYHGRVADSVSEADLSDLQARYSAEFARRGRLRTEAQQLLRQRRP